MKYPYYAITDVGYGRTNNEDYTLIQELNDDTLLAIIADGTGSHNDEFQPAAIVSNEIYEFIKKVIELDGFDKFKDNAKTYLQLALLNANRGLGLFKVANEELYSGFGASITCAIIGKNGYFIFAHTGNTRLYLIREGFKNNIKQLSIDHTKGWELVANGNIDEETYYTYPDRLKVTGGLGYNANPEIQVFDCKLNPNDSILMTTDGIHFAIKEKFISEIIIRSKNIKESCDNLILASKELKYIDNCGAIIIMNK